MRIDLQGKTALVTGSTEGIGYAIARGLGEAGARVFVNGRTPEKVDKALAQLREAAPSADFAAASGDVSALEGCLSVKEKTGPVDILVNNVGIFGPQDFFETPDEEWERFFEVNVMSGVRLSRIYMPEMQNKGWGRVIFLSSESSINIPSDMIHYGMTKTANLSVSRGLAKRMAGTGVTVNAVLPGPTLSDGARAMFQPEADRTGKTVEEVARDFVMTARPSSIIQRAAAPEEVANMVVYVASDQASATTGAALRVDGGVVDSAF